MVGECDTGVDEEDYVQSDGASELQNLMDLFIVDLGPVINDTKDFTGMISQYMHEEQ